MLQKIIDVFKLANEKGIPVPLLRDPKDKLPSISYSMVFITFNVVLFGLIGKWAKYFDIDLANALTLFGVTSGLYFGRKLTGTNNNQTQG